MKEIFVSYKSEDVERVGRLARALQSCGLEVWWDQHLPVGENWHAQIQSVLESVKCVIVVWTHTSVGPAGDFVRDEAREGKRRDILVPVRLDRVAPPLGFGEIQAIDLTRWKGSTGDPFFQDLVAAVKAKMEGRPAPAARGPMKKLRRRLTYGTLVSVLGASIAAFGSNTFHAQDTVCAAPVLQPSISDICGMFGFGKRPTSAERLTWQARRPGSCEDLRKHLGRFPQGAYQSRAQSLLADRQVNQSEVWMPGIRQLALSETQSEKALPNLEAARAEAIARAQHRADRLCRGFGATTIYRFRSARPEAQEWDCARVGEGFSCGFEGQAICELDVKGTKEEETCGK
jgi:hypothetical protein